MEKGRLVYNAIKTPDGTILNSTNRHDFVAHTDKVNKKYYAVDGGYDYSKRVLEDNAPYEDLCLYENDDFELIRKVIVRANRGINGDQDVKYVKLCDMDQDWLEATIKYNHNKGLQDHVYTLMYEKEVIYRIVNSI